MKPSTLWAVFVIVASCALSWTASAAEECGRIGRGTVRGTADIFYSENLAGGTFNAPDGKVYRNLPSFCRVLVRSTPSPESNIIVEVWMPEVSKWNRKLLGTGNGGFAGTIIYSALAGGLRRGYAVANTDMGTYPAGFAGVGYEAGNGRPQMVIDWGHRATHEMALISKMLVDDYYGKQPAHTYFVGCSTGGHQALSEAQRYPEDYDGIIAGAPGHNRTHLHAMFTWLDDAASAPGATIDMPTGKLWSDAIVKACVGKDGGAPTDTFLTDPTKCTISPKDLLCKPGESKEHCLRQAQVDLLEKFYEGMRNPRTGALIYPPEVRGAEGLLFTASTNPKQLPSGPAALSRWVFGPRWNAKNFDFDHDMAKEDQVLGKDVNALDTDLSEFAAHNGKLIMFHGWADPIVTPLDSIIYFDRITTKSEDKKTLVRLFMVPGMGHCDGGVGPDTFGQNPAMEPSDASEDLLVALDRWVTGGVAPEELTARKFPKEPATVGAGSSGSPPIATRPICAYPKIARYRGKGDNANASSFECSDAPPATYGLPAFEYLK